MAAITRELLATLRTELDTAFKQIAAKHGVAISLNRISFNDREASGKLQMIAVDAAASASGKTTTELKAEADWKREAMFMGLNPDLLGKTLTHNGVRYEIIGLMPRRTKYPVLIKSAAGRSILITVAEAQRA